MMSHLEQKKDTGSKVLIYNDCDVVVLNALTVSRSG